MHSDHGQDLPGHPNGAAAGIGHNRALPTQAVQWQRPRPHLEGEGNVGAAEIEPDLDLVEAVFSEGFATTSDPTSFLRLAQVPFEGIGADGKPLVLLRVEIDAAADVGAITPHFGGETFRYDPLPAAMVSRRRRLRFVYFDGAAPRALKLKEVRAMTTDAELKCVVSC